MKKPLTVTIIAAILFCAGNAMAGVDTWTDSVTNTDYYKFWSDDGYGNPTDMGELDHGKAHYWNIYSASLANALGSPNAGVISAELVFYDIYDTTKEGNAIYVSLFDDTKGDPNGETEDSWLNTYYDGYAGLSNFFNNDIEFPGNQTDLVVLDEGAWWNSDTDYNIPYGYNSRISALTYTFDSSQLSHLFLYAKSDKSFALAIDPDCHYNNTGIYLTIGVSENAAAVPEPATMILFGTGLVALGGMARKRIKKKQV